MKAQIYFKYRGITLVSLQYQMYCYVLSHFPLWQGSRRVDKFTSSPEIPSTQERILHTVKTSQPADTIVSTEACNMAFTVRITGTTKNKAFPSMDLLFLVECNVSVLKCSFQRNTRGHNGVTGEIHLSEKTPSKFQESQ